MLRILLIGKGGREHALAWRLSKSPRVEHVYVVPGNGGTARGLPKVSNLDTVKAEDYPLLIEEAKRLEIGLVVAGTDQAVVDGIEGFCSEAHIPCFAPSKTAAQIEGSKTWAKNFMHRHNIPTAAYSSFTTHQAALEHLRTATTSYPVVIKASGLAAGKGVITAYSLSEAEAVLSSFMLDRKFGDAGAEVVIEQFLTGPEISILTFGDGATTRTLPSAQDHKPVYEDDKGPNTGGMGVISPTPAATPEVMRRIEDEILRPTFDGLKAEGREYSGMLFTGLMLTPEGPKVLEYNARFGDPETQSVLLLLDEGETNLADVLMACTQRRLHEVEIKIKEGLHACNVVVIAGGYPGSFSQGDAIEIGEVLPEDVTLFHAGTTLRKQGEDGHEQLQTAGGRIFSVAATGTSLETAVEKAYKGVECIGFANKSYRRDIGRSSSFGVMFETYGFFALRCMADCSSLYYCVPGSFGSATTYGIIFITARD
ncbi:MAG: hypothetical protein M1831_001684 [Alyxoria varia]|nr:MAG: hypothetical protein M1831_001684 [Alyxoria varia]